MKKRGGEQSECHTRHPRIPVLPPFSPLVQGRGVPLEDRSIWSGFVMAMVSGGYMDVDLDMTTRPNGRLVPSMHARVWPSSLQPIP